MNELIPSIKIPRSLAHKLTAHTMVSLALMPLVAMILSKLAFAAFGLQPLSFGKAYFYTVLLQLGLGWWHGRREGVNS